MPVNSPPPLQPFPSNVLHAIPHPPPLPPNSHPRQPMFPLNPTLLLLPAPITTTIPDALPFYCCLSSHQSIATNTPNQAPSQPPSSTRTHHSSPDPRSSLPRQLISSFNTCSLLKVNELSVLCSNLSPTFVCIYI